MHMMIKVKQYYDSTFKESIYYINYQKFGLLNFGHPIRTKNSVFPTNISDKILAKFTPIFHYFCLNLTVTTEKWSFSLPILNEFLPKPPVTELLAKSLLENEEEGRTVSSKNDEIILKNILRGG